MQQSLSRLAAGYGSAFVASELADRPAIIVPPRERVGLAADERPIREALESPLIGVRVGLKDGKDASESLKVGLERASFISGSAAMWASRGALNDVMASNEQIIGWRRVTSGGCGACIAAATGAIHEDSEALEVHDHCQCTTEPVVRGVKDRFPRQTGPELFSALSVAEQDARVGPDAAELLRAGAISFHDLIARSPMVAQADQITQAPVSALG